MSCEAVDKPPPVPKSPVPLVNGEYTLKGRYTDFGYGDGGSDPSPDNGYSGEVKRIFDHFCSDQVVTRPGESKSVAEKREFGIYTQVECKIKPKEWNDSWVEIYQKGDNPHKFLLEPIDWTRYELSHLVTKANHWWLEVDDPFTGQYGSGGGRADSESVYQLLLKNTMFITGFLAVLSLLVVAARMAIRRDAGPAGDVARGLFTLIVVAGVGLTFTKLLLLAGDRFSNWFILQGLQGTTGSTDHCMVMNENLEVLPRRFEDMNFFLFLMCAIFMLTGAIVLFMYMIGRVFVITLVSGLLPMAAAGTATEAGRSWFKKMTANLLAFILVKPAATIVVVVSLRMAAVDNKATFADDLATVLMLFMGTVLLPSMTRLAFPFTAPAAQGDKAAQALASAPIAIGAKTVTSVIGGAAGWIASPSPPKPPRPKPPPKPKKKKSGAKT